MIICFGTKERKDDDVIASFKLQVHVLMDINYGNIHVAFFIFTVQFRLIALTQQAGTQVGQCLKVNTNKSDIKIQIKCNP
jgi:hypothetical protein